MKEKNTSEDEDMVINSVRVLSCLKASWDYKDNKELLELNGPYNLEQPELDLSFSRL